VAKGRTVSATELTDQDRLALSLCEEIGNRLAQLVPENLRNVFLKQYGFVHMSRDAGLGVAGAKLQRDALCTRGRTDKAPYSNRNLRWHPLIVAAKTPGYASEVEEIGIVQGSLVFVIEGQRWYAQEVHKLPQVYCAPSRKWHEIRDDLMQWDDDHWTGNSCVIPAAEYSRREWAIESFAVLGIAVVSNFFNVAAKRAYQEIGEVFERYGHRPSDEYIREKDLEEATRCPLCLAPLNRPPGNLRLSERNEVFQPPWRKKG